MTTVNNLISILSILIAVAFYTILERKILSYIQIRKGPNKVGLMGVLQPFSDALKLFNKNLIFTENSNFMIFSISPMISLFLALLMICAMPFYNTVSFDNKQNILLFFILSSIGVYMLLMIGWSSNSKYAYLGAIRSIAQMISYEVSFFLIILFISIMSNTYYFTQMSESQYFLWFICGNPLLFYFWFTSCLAEVNRSPFDFSEGESELVSGFNVEYMGGWFALIFLAEYTNMLILSMITTILFFFMMKNLLSIYLMILTMILMLWVRGSYPRFRYDFLMTLSWKIILPTTLFLIPLSCVCVNMN
uniref:NADH-ubiquinone oxidoreductase chain 1 n=1 Tax=Linyphia triangularis TaxID=94031 RepID=A0A7M4C8T5_LINTI|nr:NADH dehydrogenase subunit 1 [Linyphia triangularis]